MHDSALVCYSSALAPNIVLDIRTRTDIRDRRAGMPIEIEKTKTPETAALTGGGTNTSFLFAFRPQDEMRTIFKQQ